MLAGLQGLSIRASRLVALVGFLSLLGVALLTVGDVLLRWLFSAPILGLNDVVLLVTTVGVTCCFASAMAERQHMRVTATGGLLGRHGHNVFELFASLTTLAFFAALTWQFAKRSGDFSRFGDHSPLLHIPVGPFWWTATAMFGMAVIAQAIVVLDDATALATGRPIAVPSPDQIGNPTT